MVAHACNPSTLVVANVIPGLPQTECWHVDASHLDDAVKDEKQGNPIAETLLADEDA